MTITNDLILHENGEVAIAKFNATDVANELIAKVKKGTIDPLKLLEETESLKSIVEIVRKGIKEEVLDELPKYPTGYKSDFAQISPMETNIKFRYEDNDIWSAMELELTRLKTKMKEFEEFLKSIPEGETLNVDGTECVRAIRTSESSFKVSLNK